MEKMVFLSLILTFSAAAPLSAATLTVPHPYPTIQSAIIAAQNGDTVIVAPGIYSGFGNGDIAYYGKAITVQSSDPNDPAIVAATVIDCNGEDRNNRGFDFEYNEGSDSVVDGLTIINGRASAGGGIYCYYSAPTIRNCVIKNCTIQGNGGGIYCYYGLESDWSYPRIINCTISNNTARVLGSWLPPPIPNNGNGGGIYCYSSSPSIIDCTISNNTAERVTNNTTGNGGGIYAEYSSSPIITNCTISDNFARLGGGGIYLNTGNPTVINSQIASNTAGKSGGGIYSSSSNLTATNCQIAGNTAIDAGGGIYSYGVSSVINCTIAGNVAGQPGQTSTTTGYGGGICHSFQTKPELFLINSILWGNWDYYDGICYTGQIMLIGLWQPYPTPQPDPPTPQFCSSYPLDAAYNCIQWCYSPYATFICDPNDGNIDDNPQFVRDPNVIDDDFGDLHLRKDSPCINTGLSNYIAGAGVDMDNQPRIIGTRVDMGADEYAPMIIVTEPKAGNIWADGSSHEIKWESFGVSGVVDISYTLDGGTNWHQIAASEANTGNYLWQVPKRTDSNQCRVSIVPNIADANLISANSGVFEINRFVCLPGRMPNQRSQVGPKTGCVKWQFETGGPVTAAVTTYNDRAYVACEDGKLYVLNENKGTLEWIYDANSPLVASAVSVVYGMVFAGDSNGKLYAFNRQGELQWTHKAYGSIYAMPMVSQDGDVYLCSQDGTLYALGHDGSERWCFDTAGVGLLGGSIFATPQIADDDTIYLAGLYDPNLYAVNPIDGSVKWTCTFPSTTEPYIPQPDKDGVNWPITPNAGWPFAPPAIAEDGVLYQTLLYDCNMYAIEPENGNIIWSVNIADPCSGLFEPVTWTDPLGVIHTSYEYLKYSCGWSPPVVGPDGTIYVNVGNIYLEAVNPDGTIKWVMKIGAVGGLTLTVDRHGFIYAASDDKHLYVVNPDGQVISEFEGRGWLSWPVATGGGSLIVSDANNMVWSITDRDCDGQTFVLHRPGDLHPDGIIDWLDFALFAADWLGHTDNGMDYLIGDINKDLYVNFIDFAILADGWLIEE